MAACNWPGAISEAVDFRAAEDPLGTTYIPVTGLCGAWEARFGLGRRATEANENFVASRCYSAGQLGPSPEL